MIQTTPPLADRLAACQYLHSQSAQHKEQGLPEAKLPIHFHSHLTPNDRQSDQKRVS